MKTWIIGGLVAVLVGVGLYFTATKRSVPSADPVVPGVEVVEVKPEPVAPVLQQVVDVADLDALLDPPAIPPSVHSASGPMLILVGFEEPVPAERSSASVAPIPKATE